jgi:hypothetical protein
MIGERARCCSQRAADERFGRLRVASLMRQHAEQVQGVGIVRIAGENLAVEPFGLRQAAGLVQRGGVFQAGFHQGAAKERRRKLSLIIEVFWFFFSKKNCGPSVGMPAHPYQ